MSLFRATPKPSNVCPNCHKTSGTKHCRSKTCDIYLCSDCSHAFAGELMSTAVKAIR